MADNACKSQCTKECDAGDMKRKRDCSGPLSNEEKKKKSSLGVVVSLSCKDAKAVNEFLVQVFGDEAKPFFTFPKDDKIMHECRVLNGHHVYSDDADTGFLTSEQLGLNDTKQAQVVLSQYVDDAVKVAALAVKNGATEVVKVEKQFWGSTFGVVRDPQGVFWALSSKDAEAQKECSSFAIHPSERYNVAVELRLADPMGEIEWLKTVFGAEVDGEIYKNDEGKVMHAVVSMNHGGLVYLCDLVGPMPAGLCINVTVPDGQGVAMADKLAAGGGDVYMPVERQFWGAVYGRAKDKFGLDWAVMEPSGHCEESSTKTTKTCE